MAKITKQQYDELKEAYACDDQQFAEKLEEYTGITRRAYVAYDYFDFGGDYVGNSVTNDLDDILRMGYVRVTEDGK